MQKQLSIKGVSCMFVIQDPLFVCTRVFFVAVVFDLPCVAQAVVVLAGFDRVGMFMCSIKRSANHKVKHSQRACAILQALSCQTVVVARCVGLSYSLYRYSLSDSSLKGVCPFLVLSTEVDTLRLQAGLFNHR